MYPTVLHSKYTMQASISYHFHTLVVFFGKVKLGIDCIVGSVNVLIYIYHVFSVGERERKRKSAKHKCD
jgi:hypothetical protein